MREGAHGRAERVRFLPLTSVSILPISCMNGDPLPEAAIVRLVTPSLALLIAAGFVGAPVARASDAQPTPAAALERLKAGNERFVADPASAVPVEPGRRAALVAGQSPFAIVLSCADSRVPPELVFNVGLGDVFVVRTAGEVLDKAVLASVEYGAEHLHVPLVVVMGHEFCGAVKAAAETKGSLGPNLDYLVKAIQPSVARSSKSLFEEPLKAAVLANVEQIVTDLRGQSAILRELVETGKVQLVGAFYELSSGRVTFSLPIGGEKEKDAPKPSPTAHTRPNEK